MSVFRINKNTNYTIMSNHHLRNENLSLKAKGLMSIMLSLPPDWGYSISGLCAISREGSTAIKSALNELKNEGYLVITKLMPNETKSHKIEYVYDIFEVPKDIHQEQGFQYIENLPVENQYIENQGQLNKDYKVRNNKIKNIEVEELSFSNQIKQNIDKNNDILLEYKSIDELSVEELQKLKQVVLENRNTKQITYRNIQKQFHLIDKVTYDTPEICNDLIKIKKKIQRYNETIKDETQLSNEIF